MRRLLLLSCLMLAACDGGSAPATVNKDFAMNPLSDINTRLAFTCKHETIPAPSAETDMLFRYARWLQVNNRLKEDRAVDAQTERLYRIAAATRQVFHLSMAPETGWYLRGEHQSVCERVSMTEEGFFQAVDRLA
ncbi:hypothetical protein [Atlantibacter hermannii]|uniref:hypothetical protein n=1 Tax=Atlantibacter hermannii TaxID=565 RepID=UPI003327E62C